MTRPRGFIEAWNPQAKTRSQLEAVEEILEEYADHLPLTIRQVFYRLVGLEVIGKSEKDYSNLCELLGRARRAQVIPMDAIRDDGFTGGFGTRLGFTGPDEFRSEIADTVESYQIDRQQGQPTRLVLWCEASGMVPQLQRVAEPYGVTVKSSGGFDSLTAKHSAAVNFYNVTVLHVGDHDPSGVCMFDALAEDIQAFGEHYGNEIDFERIAVTPEQIRIHTLPTAPPKKSSHQVCKPIAETVQAEALDPATLADIVRAEIETRLDMSVYRQAVKLEGEQRDELREWITNDF